MFNDSIRNNLSWVLDDKIDDNKIWDALKLANADKFVSELPEKLNTNIGERACNYQVDKDKAIIG